MEQMGKYQLVRKLATGGMAEVFLAKAAGPKGFEKTLVIKRILPNLAEDPEFIDMFLAEAKLAALLNHANIVQIYDFGEENGSYFLAMEYVEGPNLRTLARSAFKSKTPISYPLIARLLSQACEGLAFAHELRDPQSGKPLRLIHRDISSDNLLVSRNGGVKLVDFGIAKAANVGQRTQSGVLKGKVSYMAPEYLMGKALDARADLYALGVVLFEVLTGRKPFEASSDGQLVRAILHEPPLDVRALRADVPAELAQVLGRALAREREERYRNCREMQADLESYLLQSGQLVGALQLAELVKQLVPVLPSEGKEVAPAPVKAAKRGTRVKAREEKESAAAPKEASPKRKRARAGQENPPPEPPPEDTEHRAEPTRRSRRSRQVHAEGAAPGTPEGSAEGNAAPPEPQPPPAEVASSAPVSGVGTKPYPPELQEPPAEARPSSSISGVGTRRYPPELQEPPAEARPSSSISGVGTKRYPPELQQLPAEASPSAFASRIETKRYPPGLDGPSSGPAPAASESITPPKRNAPLLLRVTVLLLLLAGVGYVGWRGDTGLPEVREAVHALMPRPPAAMDPQPVLSSPDAPTSKSPVTIDAEPSASPGASGDLPDASGMMAQVPMPPGMREGLDASVPRPDASVSGPGAFVARPDASVSGPDASVAGPDASVSEVDASVSGIDASVSGPDASVSGADASVSGPDASVSGADASVSGAGAAVARPDASTPVPDASVSGADVSRAELESSVSELEAADTTMLAPVRAEPGFTPSPEFSEPLAPAVTVLAPLASEAKATQALDGGSSAGAQSRTVSERPSAPRPAAARPAPTVAAKAPAVKPKQATLVVRSELPATIRIQGKEVGKTPMQSSTEPGRVRIEVYGKGPAGLFYRFEDIELRAGEKRQVSFSFPKLRVTLRSSQEGMRVLAMDGQRHSGGMEIITYEGLHQLELLHTATGKKYTSECEVRPGDKLCRFSVTLSR